MGSLPPASPKSDALAATLRRRIAPGRLGGPLAAAIALALAVASGSLLSLTFRRSSHCGRCGGRICGRCDRGPTTGRLCTTCRGVFASTGGDPKDRLERGHRILSARAQAERFTRWAALLVPGALGVRGRRSFSGLLLSLVFCAGVGAFALRGGVLADPQALGGAATLALMGLAGLMALVYAAGLCATAFIAGRHD